MLRPGRWLPAICLMLCATVLPVAGADLTPGVGPQPITRAEAYRRAAALGVIGRRMFVDPRLSASGRLSCASCHDPAAGYGPPNALAVQLGGPDMHQPGIRAVPSLTYLQAAPHFTEHFFDSDDEGDESIDNGPTGGLTWDGRVDVGREQARIPLLSPFEMANETGAAVAARVRAAGYLDALRDAVGADAVRDDQAVFDAATKALEIFEQDAATFYPYDSKYDAFLAGRAQLTEQEARGLSLFEDPEKGNCAQCHLSRPAHDGTPPQFTDFGLIALGVPRNPAIPANADPAYVDLGLCGPVRTDLAGRAEYCGLFMTPTLRNVALRRTFFHNGVVHSLRDAVRFYVERETRPEEWYPRDPSGAVVKYDDLPAAYHANLNREAPFDRDKPALTPAEIDDVVAFLQILTDGYSPQR